MRNKPNFNKSIQAAYEAIATHNIQDFPIDILSIFKSYEDVKVITYSEMARKHKCTLEEIIKINSSEDGVIHYCGIRKKYLVAYNDAIGHEERVYWTLGHELGHYLLKHHEESDRASLAQNCMSEHEYYIYEVEANFFTRFFLTPPSLIVETKMTNYRKVMSYFGVSYSSATNTLRYIQDRINRGWSFHVPGKIKHHLNSFISKVRYGKTCVKCDYFFVVENSVYCPVCNGERFNFDKKGDEAMIYSKINLNEENRPYQCPRCKNEKLPDTEDNCQICGVYLLNRCTGFTIHDSFRNDEHIRWHSFDGGCPSLLEGDARFCPTCGSTSTYYEEGLLEHWEDEKRKLESDSSQNSQPVNVYAGPNNTHF